MKHRLVFSQILSTHNREAECNTISNSDIVALKVISKVNYIKRLIA